MNIAYSLFLAILLFCPLAFGTVETWSLAVMELACFSALLIRLTSNWKKPLYSVPGLLPLLLFVAYLILQILPLPCGLVALLSPAAFELHQGTLGIIGMPDFIPLSVNPHATLAEVFRFASYACLYILTVQLLAHPKRFRFTVNFLVGFGFAIALFGIIQKYLPNGNIYWLRPAPEGAVFYFGPYVNRNHFAGFMEMLLPLAIGLFFYFRPRISYAKTIREKVVAFFDRPQSNYHFLSGFAAVIMAGSIFATLSRGGSISCSISIIFLLFLLYIREKKNPAIFLSIAFISCTLIAVSWFGWEDLAARFEALGLQDGELRLLRPTYWRDSLVIFKDFPLFGTGYGTFANIFPSYRSFSAGFFLYHAHNDYIETLTDGGIVAIVLIACFLFSLLRFSLKTIRTRRDTLCINVFLGSLAGMLALLIHSVSDFNFQSGANALYFFLLAGLLVSAAHTRLHGSKPSLLPCYSGGGIAAAGFTVMICLLGAGLLFHGSRLAVDSLDEKISPVVWESEVSKEKLLEADAAAQKAVTYDPLNSYYHFLSASLANRLGDQTAARQRFEKAIKLNPTQPTYLQDFGVFLSNQGMEKEADLFLQAGIRHDRSNGDRYREYGQWLIRSNGNMETALKVYGQAMDLNPEYAKDDIQFLAGKGYRDRDIQLALPDRVRPHLAFAEFLVKNGEEVMAESAYRNALKYGENETGSLAYAYQKVYDFFARRNRYDEALEIMLQATAHEPKHVSLHLIAAKLYEKMGLMAKATDEYRKVLTIEPRNKSAQQRFQDLSR
ncbi:MAG: O-antigen ligase family protein [Proteobacteria bacterium]|nr:O-antigen ligase family protein [Pseudomonadota bacterium]